MSLAILIHTDSEISEFVLDRTRTYKVSTHLAHFKIEPLQPLVKSDCGIICKDFQTSDK